MIALASLPPLNDLRRVAAAAARSSFLINASVPVGAGSQSTDVSARFCFRPNSSARAPAHRVPAADKKQASDPPGNALPQ